MDIRKIDADSITGLKKDLNLRGLSPPRKNHHLVVLRNLLSFAKAEENLDVYDFNRITKFKVPVKEVEYLTEEELIRLANCPKESNITGLRLRAAIWTLISTGCRASELLNLRKSNIDSKNGVAQIRTKGDKPHQIIFNRQSLDAINKYLEKRNDDEEWVFVTAVPNPKRWKISDLERSLRGIGKKMGFKKNIRPHLIRKSSATLLFKKGTPLGVVQSYLNHSSPQITSRFYLGSSNFEELRRNHDRVMNNLNSEI